MLRSRAPRRRSNKSFRPTTLKLGGAGVRCPIFSGPHLKLSISCPCRFVFLRYFYVVSRRFLRATILSRRRAWGSRPLCRRVCVAQSHSSNRLFVLMLSGMISSAARRVCFTDRDTSAAVWRQGFDVSRSRIETALGS